MVEYSEEEVLTVAKSKYDVAEFLFIGEFLHGEVENDGNLLKITPFDDVFSSDFVNGDNIQAALTSFAGKNGGHDIQGRYSYFLSYVALARCTDGALKFIYYNTNISKNADIYDTIGASDYNLDISPTEITDDLFRAPEDFGEMSRYLSSFKGANPRDFLYSYENLTYRCYNSAAIVSEIEFYRENGAIVYDIYYDSSIYDDEERRLIYSSSDRYGVIYHSSSADFTEYFDISTVIEPSTEESGTMVLRGSIDVRNINGEVIYSEISYRAEYPTIRDGEVVITESTDQKIDKLSIKTGYGFPASDLIDHNTAKFELTDYYILYIKDKTD